MEVFTVTSTTPAVEAAGVRQPVIWVPAPFTTQLVAVLLPNVTELIPVKLVPLMVTGVLPVTGP